MRRRWPFLITDLPADEPWEQPRSLARMEDVWAAAKAWGEARGHRYVSSYGVEGVAPT